MDRTEVLIVGQGIAGSMLAYELLKSGRKVRIMDDLSEKTSSKVAAGLYNPITGRHMVKTWLADEIFPNLGVHYEEMERDLGEKFHFPMTIYRPFFSITEQNDWMGKSESSEYSDLVLTVNTSSLGHEGFIDPYGGVQLQKCGYVDMIKLIHSFNLYFDSKGILIPQLFDFRILETDGELLKYGNLEFDLIVFCEGDRVINNPFWQHLSFRLVKGEVFTIDFSSDSNIILNRGVFMIPKDGFSTVGSTYDHKNLDWEPSERGINSIKEKLSKIFSGKYRILSKWAGIRPATFDRRPFIGFHKDDKRIGIFNGFGTKGVSLVPYFAKQFAKQITNGERMLSEVAIDR